MVQQRSRERQERSEPKEIREQRLKMQALESEVPKLRSLFQKTRLFAYIETPELQERFLNTVFYGLVAKESAFGTFTRHLTKNGRKRLKKLKIPAQIFKSWTILKAYGETREIPQATLQRYGIANQSALEQLITECTINKGVYQITPINLKDIGEHVQRGALKEVWGTRVGTWESDADRTDIEKARKLCVLSFERIYEICRIQASTRYMKNRKQSLVNPLMIMGYKCGGGAANKLLEYANKEKFRSNALWTTIDWGIEEGIITTADKNYLKKILFFRDNLQPNISQIARNENLRESTTQQSQQQRRELSLEVIENNLTTQTRTTERTSPSQETQLPDLEPSINFPNNLENLEYRIVKIPKELQLPQRPYLDTSIELDPEIFSNEFIDQSNQKTFGDFYFDNQNRTIDEITETELIQSIIQKYSPRFSASRTSAGQTEIYKFPFGIEFKKITTSANTTISILSYNQNLKELFSSTHINYYNSWPLNPTTQEQEPVEQEIEETIPAPIQEPRQTQKRQEIEEANKESETPQELTWADIFNESNPITEFSDSDVQYFILDTFMPERETETRPNGTTIHTDTYPFGIVVKTTINNNMSFQSMPIPDPRLREELLRTPLKNYPRKPNKIDRSYTVN